MLLVFQLLSVMVLLSIIGEPLRMVIRRYSSLFHELNILQIVVLDVYLGGIVLYALAAIPLGLFNVIILWTITLMCIAFLTIFYLRKLRAVTKSAEQEHTSIKIKAKNYLLTRKGTLLECSTVLAIFFVALSIQVTPITKFVFGSIYDTSLHALFVELILENGQIPATHHPYLSAAIIYPQGAHVIFAYASCILGFIPPKTVFYLTPLFSAMTVLAAYYLGKKISPTQKLGMIFAFIMAFVSMWPQFITWGGNPFVVGFPLFFICLGFLPFLLDLFNRNKIVELSVIGVLFGYLAALNLAFYEVLIASSIIWLLVEAVRKHTRMRSFRNFLIMCTFSLLLIAPFLYRFVRYYPYPGHNIGLPNDIVADVTSSPTPKPSPWQSPIVSILANFPTWLVSLYNIHPNPALRIVWIGLAFASFLTLFVSFHGNRKLLVTEKIGLAVFASVIFLNFCTFIMPLVVWTRISFLLYISVCLLIATFNIRLYPTLQAFFVSVFHKIVGKDKKKVALASLVATILVFSTLYVPFIHYTISISCEECTKLCSLYAITGESDYKLMTWMKDHLPSNVTVLINAYEPGLFIPSVSQKKVVFPMSAYWLSSSYRRLINLIQQGVVNQTTYALMNHFSITHVFLGSRGRAGVLLQWQEENVKWDPFVFLGNPTFKLIKNVGNSYLFSVASSPNPNILFRENFEDLNLTQMRWRSGQVGYGNYSMNVTCNESGNRLLRMMALKNQTSRWFYSCWLNRKVYLADALNVTLSFDLNASGVSPPNTVELSVFDVNRTRHVTFATPSVLHQNQSNVLELQPYLETFNFDLNKIWMEKFQEPIPNVIVVELAVVNVDATYPTVAFFDNIILTINQ
ncbi:MAG: hypothetical protein U9O89_01560 [Thermoproteota archaeon]|nr:hypothetical protein [Thermoproteota archaeon]